MTFGNFYFAGSPQSLLVVILTAFALFATAFLLVLSVAIKKPIVPGLGCGCLGMFGAGIIALGIIFGMIGKAHMERSLAWGGYQMDAQQMEIEREMGKREYQQPMIFGVLGGSLPMLAGFGLGLLALKRRQENS